jgi:tetratricopeptide (TPR) repeat protein
MMRRLDQLLRTDTKSSWRMIILSAAAIAIWGTIAELRGDSVHEAQVGAFTCGALIFLLQVLVYCVPPAKPATRLEWAATVPRRLIVTAAAAIVLAAIPGPALEGAILDRRLRALTRDGKLSPQQAKEVTRALDLAAAGPIKLPDGTRVQVYQAIKRSALEHPDSPTILDSATDLVRYIREVDLAPTRATKANRTSTEAWKAYENGLAHEKLVSIAPPDWNNQEARKAASELTRAIELATPQDRGLLTAARAQRAQMYLILLQPADALSDVEALESLGGGDLPTLLYLEGMALVMRGGHDDLERAVRVLTLFSILDPRTGGLPDQGAVHYEMAALANRGQAYYRLGDFENSILDNKHFLDLLHKRQDLSAQGLRYGETIAYLAIVASYLQLGDFDQAKMEAHNWLQESGGNDPAALETISQLESNHFDRQRWLEAYIKAAK